MIIGNVVQFMETKTKQFISIEINDIEAFMAGKIYLRSGRTIPVEAMRNEIEDIITKRSADIRNRKLKRIDLIVDKLSGLLSDRSQN